MPLIRSKLGRSLLYFHLLHFCLLNCLAHDTQFYKRAVDYVSERYDIEHEGQAAIGQSHAEQVVENAYGKLGQIVLSHGPMYAANLGDINLAFFLQLTEGDLGEKQCYGTIKENSALRHSVFVEYCLEVCHYQILSIYLFLHFHEIVEGLYFHFSLSVCVCVQLCL